MADIERLRKLAEELERHATNEEALLSDTSKSNISYKEKAVRVLNLRQWAKTIRDSIE